MGGLSSVWDIHSLRGPELLVEMSSRSLGCPSKAGDEDLEVASVIKEEEKKKKKAGKFGR